MKTLTRRSLLILATVLTCSPVIIAQVAPAVSAKAMLDAEATTAAINATDFETRTRLLADIEGRMNNAGEVVADLHHKLDLMSAEGQKAFKPAHITFRQKEDELKRVVRTAYDATKKTWLAARSTLSLSFTAYSESVAQLEKAVAQRDDAPSVRANK